MSGYLALGTLVWLGFILGNFVIAAILCEPNGFKASKGLTFARIAAWTVFLANMIAFLAACFHLGGAY